jgi:thiamine-phosphate pyrophosphorylase
VLAQIRGAIAGGVDVVQIRERGFADRDYAVFLKECVRVTRGTSCRVVVNDRLDLAIAVGADGVHLREDGVGIEAVRQVVGREFVVGRSIHDAAAAAHARTADYLIAGSVFETASKPDGHPTVGLDGLRAMVRAADTCPVWAIGGMTAERMRDVTTAGARGVAAIGAFFPPANARDVRGAAEDVARRLRFSLDRAAELP